MATDKTFSVAGISKLNGDYKVRFANDIMRIKVLAKSGHEDIRLAELDKAMTKLEAAKVIQGMDEFQDVVAQATIAEYLEDNAPKAPKAKTSPAVSKAKATPKVKSMAGKIPPLKAPAKTAKVTEDEDAPF